MHWRAITFKLGGYYRECDHAEFAWGMGLYCHYEVVSPQFASFYHVTRRGFQPEEQDITFWQQIANRTYETKSAQESYIRSPIHHFIHRLLTFSINHKQHGDKVSRKNIFYLWSIITLATFCDIPCMLACLLVKMRWFSRPGSPITKRHFVPHLAKSYGVLTSAMIVSLTGVSTKNLVISFLEIMQVVEIVRGVYGIPADDLVILVEQVEEPR